MQAAQIRTEEGSGLFERGDAALDEESRQHPVDFEFLRQSGNQHRITLIIYYPLFIDGHNTELMMSPVSKTDAPGGPLQFAKIPLLFH